MEGRLICNAWAVVGARIAQLALLAGVDPAAALDMTAAQFDAAKRAARAKERN
jgi:hypothetical protein